MLLNKKIISAAVIISQLAAIATLFVSIKTASESIHSLEDQMIERNIIRINNGIEQNISSLADLVNDWAKWNELYDFVKGENPEFIENNVNTGQLLNTSLNYFFILNEKSEVIISFGADVDKKIGVIVSDKITKEIIDLANDNLGKGFSGLMSDVDGKPMMIVGRRILRTDGSGPSAGMIIFTRKFSYAIMERIKSLTIFNSMVVPAKDFGVTLSPANKDLHIYGSLPVYIDEREENFAHGYSFIKDADGNNSFIAKVEVSRNAHDKSTLAIKFVIAVAIAMNFVAIIFTLLLFNQSIVKRPKETPEKPQTNKLK